MQYSKARMYRTNLQIISSVPARMCSTNQVHHQYTRECTVRARHIISSNEDVQYEQGTSSVQARMCSTAAKVDHQVLVQ